MRPSNRPTRQPKQTPTPIIPTPKPPGISDVGLELLLDKASTIAPADRSMFLTTVVQLLPNDVVSDSMVERTCRVVYNSMTAKGRKGSDEIDAELEKRLVS